MIMPLRRFKESGIHLFAQYLTELKAGGTAAPPIWLLTDDVHTEVVEPETDVPNATFANRLAAAKHLDELFTRAELSEVSRDVGLWAWLSLRYFDQLCPADKSGRREPGQFSDGAYVRLIPAVGANRRYYRHLLLGPYMIFRTYHDSPAMAMSLLVDPPHVATAEAYRLFVENPSLISCRAAVGVATALYFDSDANKMRRGYGRKTGGGCRRLVQVLQQLDLTFDLYSLSVERLLGLLPSEFDPFRPRQLRLAI